ncbi:MAG: hypothetical protein C5B50_28135 [Verrucomicrobia bacterium]|nr:MAG: hypothetical protein C5B50_28135 [Verrucomicrobiota bacterium]
MKIKNLLLIITTILTLLAAPCSRSELFYYLTATITSVQQKDSTDDGLNTTYPLPKVRTYATIDLLNLLARAKYAQGLWPATNFPANAKLGISGGRPFSVITGTNIIDVSDIFTLTTSTNEITSGKTSDSTGLSNPTSKTLQIAKYSFDDTAIPGSNGLQFYIQGIAASTKTDTVPAGGVYTRSFTSKLVGAGEGTSSSGHAFVLTGSVTLSAHGQETIIGL